MLRASSSTRARGLALIRAAGARVIRIPVNWANVARRATPGDRATDPASPGYDFALIDRAVQDAAAAVLEPLLVVSHAPAFAEAPARWRFAYPGSWAPNPSALGAFAQALAARYDGAFPAPLRPGQALPRVRLLQAWNEPNLPRYIEPQWIVSGGRWTAFSPLIYREMLNAFYMGVKTARSDDVVITAGLSPLGDPVGVGRMAPVSFLRSLLCLTSSGRRVRDCADIAHFDVLSFHPYSVGNPDLPAASARDVSIADLAKITHPLARAERLGTALPAGPKPVWVTELNWESDPPSPTGVVSGLRAHWIARALHRLWVGGVTLVDWHFLQDPRDLHLATPTGGIVDVFRPAGLYRTAPDGQRGPPKPFLRGFALPFDAARYDDQRIRVWALLPAPGMEVQVQAQRRRMWRAVALVRANPDAIVNVVVRVRGSARLRIASGGQTSAAWSVPSGRSTP